MTDFSDPQTANLRLANSERDEAVAQLNANLREGRLDEAEFTKRRAVVNSAVTHGDLASLFADLPRPEGAGTGSQQPVAPQPVAPHLATPPPTAPHSAAGGPYGAPQYDAPQYDAPQYSAPPAGAPATGPARKGPIGGTAGVIAVSISPFVSLVLFFLTGALVSWNYSWLWFLLVPLTYVIVYGAGTRERPDRHR